jgi:hypothetical protein
LLFRQIHQLPIKLSLITKTILIVAENIWENLTMNGLVIMFF